MANPKKDLHEIQAALLGVGSGVKGAGAKVAEALEKTLKSARQRNAYILKALAETSVTLGKGAPLNDKMAEQLDRSLTKAYNAAAEQKNLLKKAQKVVESKTSTTRRRKP